MIWDSVQIARSSLKSTLEFKNHGMVKDVWRVRATTLIAAITADEVDRAEVLRLSNLFKDDGSMLREIAAAHECVLTHSQFMSAPNSSTKSSG